MAAIITDEFRRDSTTFLLEDIKDQLTGALDSPNGGGSFEYFIGIGKSDSWDNDASNNPETDQNFSTPLPNGSVIESKEILDNLIGAIAIQPANAYNVIPRIDWVANRRYKRWNENDPTMFDVSTVGANTYYPCYAIYEDKIYVCLDNDSNDSYVSNGQYVPGLSQYFPEGDSTSAANRAPSDPSADGYSWVYVADLSPSSEFNTDQFVSISSTATGTATEATTASGGIVYGFEIVNPGTGVTGTGFKLLLSDDTMETPVEMDLTATISGGAIIGIKFDESVHGSQATAISLTNGTARASIVHTGTSTTAAVIRPLVSPRNGFGFNPLKDLPAFYAGLAVNYNGNVGGELPTSVSYRQISLLRDPTRNDDDSPDPSGDGSYTEPEVYNALRRFEVSGTPDLSSISQGDIITDTSTGLAVTGAKAFVDYVDDTNDYIYFHQNESASINQQDFTTADGVNSKITIGATEYTVTAVTDPEFTPRTGEVVFLENRKPIQRAASQEEEIKLVIQF